VSRGGCQARMGLVVAAWLRRGAGYSRLTAGHRCRTCTTLARAIQLAGRPGEEVSSPGPPPLPPLAGSSHLCDPREPHLYEGMVDLA
jgi:hypothetical protein